MPFLPVRRIPRAPFLPHNSRGCKPACHTMMRSGSSDVRGKEPPRTELAGFTTVMYVWQGKGSLGANMNAMFQNDALVSKAQMGMTTRTVG
jgi:hypothetical protein